ncbi:MAG: flippase [Calditrichaeota bacterium]|nr:MAG: flippase [Calditrichota bacterium]
MSKLQRLFKNTLVLMLANVLQPVMAFYLIVVISDLMGAEGLGEYNTIFNYLLIFQVSAAFGLRNLLTRDLAQNKENTAKYLVNGSLIALVSSCASAGFMGLSAWLISDDSVIITGTYIASLSLIATGVGDVYEGAIRGYEHITQIGYAWIVENFARVIICLWLIFNGYGIIALVWTYVALRFLKVFYYGWYVNRNIERLIQKLEWAFVWQLVGKTKVFALTVFAVTIYWRADIIMLEAIMTEREAGFYSAAYRFLAIAIILVDSFVNSLFPVLANLHVEEEDNFQIACRKSLRLLVTAVTPVALLASLYAREVILFVFPQEFEISIPVLQLIIWTIVPYSISQIFAYALVAAKKQHIDLLVNVLAMLANVILNWFFIPRWGVMGATMATFISIFIYVGIQFPFVYQKTIVFPTNELFSRFHKIALPLLVILLIYFTTPGYSWLVITPLAFILYLIALFVFGGINKGDRALLKRLMKR